MVDDRDSFFSDRLNERTTSTKVKVKDEVQSKKNCFSKERNKLEYISSENHKRDTVGTIHMSIKLIESRNKFFKENCNISEKRVEER